MKIIAFILVVIFNCIFKVISFSLTSSFLFHLQKPIDNKLLKRIKLRQNSTSNILSDEDNDRLKIFGDGNFTKGYNIYGLYVNKDGKETKEAKVSFYPTYLTKNESEKTEFQKNGLVFNFNAKDDKEDKSNITLLLKEIMFSTNNSNVNETNYYIPFRFIVSTECVTTTRGFYKVNLYITNDSQGTYRLSFPLPYTRDSSTNDFINNTSEKDKKILCKYIKASSENQREVISETRNKSNYYISNYFALKPLLNDIEIKSISLRNETSYISTKINDTKIQLESLFSELDSIREKVDNLKLKKLVIDEMLLSKNNKVDFIRTQLDVKKNSLGELSMKTEDSNKQFEKVNNELEELMSFVMKDKNSILEIAPELLSELNNLVSYVKENNPDEFNRIVNRIIVK